MSAKAETIVPRAFVWRRVHSLLGLWLVIYLIEHLVVNSQAALWIGDDGAGFVRLVNLIQDLPYLQVIEIVLLGVPLLIHAVWGVKYILTSKSNSRSSDGSKPSLQYGRNYAYTFQRLSSWILLVGIILHVVQMRFLDKPVKVLKDDQEQYLVKLNYDSGLDTLAVRLHVQLFGNLDIADLKGEGLKHEEKVFFEGSRPKGNAQYNADKGAANVAVMENQEAVRWTNALSSFSLKEGQIVAAAPTPGTAILLTTRDTFKSPLMGILYTIFVAAAAFHAFNGAWIFLNTWGFILSMRSQNSMVNVSIAVMIIFLFLGLAAIWGSYWINLRN